jgi:hypothetical protein
MKLTDQQKKYYDLHLRCPICLTKVVETFLNPPDPVYGVDYRDTVNRTACNECGWNGPIDRLKR